MGFSNNKKSVKYNYVKRDMESQRKLRRRISVIIQLVVKSIKLKYWESHRNEYRRQRFGEREHTMDLRILLYSFTHDIGIVTVNNNILQ